MDSDSRLCGECGATVSPASRYGPHVSGHRRTSSAKYVYDEAVDPGHKHPLTLRACAVCGVEKLMRVSGAGFCSYRCSQLGENNSNWAESPASKTTGYGRAHRSLPKNVLPETCPACGREDKKIHRHHKDVDPMNNDPSNLEILCSTCHAQEHARLRKGGQ